MVEEEIAKMTSRLNKLEQENKDLKQTLSEMEKKNTGNNS